MGTPVLPDLFDSSTTCLPCLTALAQVIDEPSIIAPSLIGGGVGFASVIIYLKFFMGK